jgi:hypothetical protein
MKVPKLLPSFALLLIAVAAACTSGEATGENGIASPGTTEESGARSSNLADLVSVDLFVVETADPTVLEATMTVTNISGQALRLYHPAGGPVMFEVMGGFKDLLWREPESLDGFAVSEMVLAKDESLTYTTTINTREFDPPVPPVVPGWVRGSFGASLGGPETEWEPVPDEMDPLIVQWVESGLEFVMLNNEIPQ